MSSKFKVQTSPKPRVDERALAAFSAGANTHSAAPVPAASPVAPSVVAGRKRPERATESFLLRLTPSQMETLNFVFERSTVKSKQKLVESILIPELVRQAEGFRDSK